MKQVYKNAAVFRAGRFLSFSPFVFEGRGEDVSHLSSDFVSEIKCIVVPGFIDVHVHFREPGFSYKETIAQGSRAAARGGYTAVCTMPNLNPVPDSLPRLKEQLDIIRRDGKIRVLPYGAITVGEEGKELSDMEAIAPHVVGFSDDGRGVQDEKTMKEAMLRAKALGKIIAAHCEDKSLIHGGYINECEYQKKNGHLGISNESEWGQIERDLYLAEKTGVKYHVCHVSCAESVELIRRAKARGADVSCETAPHYLLLDDSALKEDGAYKMNPPLRSKKDREALIEALADGTIDMIATDHAPHTAEEKSRGLKDSPMGITGLECAFPVLYTGLCKEGIISPEKLISLMSENPSKRFGIPCEGYAVIDIERKYKINSSDFLSKGKTTPFDGNEVYGKTLLTVWKGDAVWQDNFQES